jgi:hypothetical protein|tara:strand:+ start:275 stop:790 length:516 start_codon:yes stop_codon:yes gene_type:complete
MGGLFGNHVLSSLIPLLVFFSVITDCGVFDPEIIEIHDTTFVHDTLLIHSTELDTVFLPVPASVALFDESGNASVVWQDSARTMFKLRFQGVVIKLDSIDVDSVWYHAFIVRFKDTKYTPLDHVRLFVPPDKEGVEYEPFIVYTSDTLTGEYVYDVKDRFFLILGDDTESK